MSDSSLDDAKLADYEDSEVESSESEEDDSIRCIKLPLARNIAAYIEKQELSEETDVVACDSNLIENVINNYIIVKKILSTLPWQEKMLCKHVCKMWRSAVLALQKEQLAPADFVLDLQICSIKNGVKYKHSGNFYTEPLVVFTFANTAGFGVTSKCVILLPHPCDPPCEKEHCCKFFSLF